MQELRKCPDANDKYNWKVTNIRKKEKSKKDVAKQKFIRSELEDKKLIRTKLINQCKMNSNKIVYSKLK